MAAHRNARINVKTMKAALWNSAAFRETLIWVRTKMLTDIENGDEMQEPRESSTRKNSMTPLEGALELAGLGFKLFPLRPGTKAGFTSSKSWKQQATSSPRMLREMASYGCNFGMWCRGHVVLDVDTANGKSGLDDLIAIQLDKGLPETRIHRSARGGLHLIFRAPPGVEFTNRAKPLGEGIDVRGAGGYVVAPGSTFEGQPYTVENPAPIADAPAWLVETLQSAAHAITVAPEGIDLDSAANVQLATSWLLAQPVKDLVGSRGSRTYKAACHIRDMAISHAMARMLVNTHLVSRFDPPYDVGQDTTDAEVAHAYTYAQNAIGVKAIESFFEVLPDDIVPEPEEENLTSKVSIRDRIKPLTITPDELEALPPRQWIVPRRLLREHISVCVAPGGVGKSLWALQLAVALAIGDGQFMGLSIAARSRVLMVNLEDDEDELKRRLAGIVTYFNLPFDRINEGWLEIYDARKAGFKVMETARAKGAAAALQETDTLAAIKHYALDRGIDVVIIDPFVETHDGNENDNVQIAQVAAAYRGIARECKCAALIVHHTRKPPQASAQGFVGQADVARGASALTNAARIVFTLFNVSEGDKELIGIDPKQAHRYVRIDDAKGNYQSKQNVPEAYKRVSVLLPNGDEVGVLDFYRPGAPAISRRQEECRNAVAEVLRRALARVDGKPNAYLSPNKTDSQRYIMNFLKRQHECTGYTPAELEEARTALDALIVEEEFENPNKRGRANTKSKRYALREPDDCDSICDSSGCDSSDCIASAPSGAVASQ